MSYWEEEKNKKMTGELKGAKLLVKLMWWLGLCDSKKLKSQIINIEKNMQSIIKNIDESNDYLWKQWRATFGSLNMEVSKKAIELYKSWDIASADNILMQEVENMLNRFKKYIHHIKAFKDRGPLIFLAIKDHEEWRYHASIPVLLSCMDWIVNDLTPEQKGLFAEGDHIEIPNSIVWHKWWLPTVIKLISQTRRKTNLDSLKIPYRNWIVHWHDINYYNKLVSTRTLALLFAVHDRAIDLSKEKQEVKKSKNVENKWWWKSIIDYIEMNKKFEYQKKIIEERKPRNDEYLNKIILNKEFNTGTPEYVLIEQFKDLQNKKYWKVIDSVWISFRWKESINLSAWNLRNKLNNIEFVNCEIISIKDEVPAISEIEFMIAYKNNWTLENRKVKQRIIYEDNVGNPLPSNMKGGTWRMVFGIEDLLDIY